MNVSVQRSSEQRQEAVMHGAENAYQTNVFSFRLKASMSVIS